MREGLQYKVWHCGVEEKFVEVCEGLYIGVETRVVIRSKVRGGLYHFSRKLNFVLYLS